MSSYKMLSLFARITRKVRRNHKIIRTDGSADFIIKNLAIGSSDMISLFPVFYPLALSLSFCPTVSLGRSSV